MNNMTHSNHHARGWKQLAILISGVTLFVMITLALDFSFSDEQGITIDPLKAHVAETLNAENDPIYNNEMNPFVEDLDDGETPREPPQASINTPTIALASEPNSSAPEPNSAAVPDATQGNASQSKTHYRSLDEVYDQVFARDFSPEDPSNNQTQLTPEEAAIAAAITGIAISDNKNTPTTPSEARATSRSKATTKVTAKATAKTKQGVKKATRNTKQASNTNKSTVSKRTSTQQRRTKKSLAKANTTKRASTKPIVSKKKPTLKSAKQSPRLHQSQNQKLTTRQASNYRNTLNKSAALSRTDINNKALDKLLSKLMNAYEKGDLSRLVGIFSRDIRSNEGSSIENIKDDYRKLFNITDMRKMRISDIRWSETKKKHRGVGKFRLLIREKGAAEVTSYTGNISIDVEKSGKNLLITQLNYHYNN